MVSWLRQPTTIIGIAVIVGGLVGYGVWMLTRDAGATMLGVSLSAGIVKIAMPDNTAARSATQKLVDDALTALVQHNVRAAVVQSLIGDVGALFDAVGGKAAVTASTTTVAAGDQHPQEKTP